MLVTIEQLVKSGTLPPTAASNPEQSSCIGYPALCGIPPKEPCNPEIDCTEPSPKMYDNICKLREDKAEMVAMVWCTTKKGTH